MGPFPTLGTDMTPRMSSEVMTIYAGPNETKFTVHKHLLLPDTLTRYEEIHLNDHADVVV
ncbi:hypothetical protein CGCTS75_v008408 [Colletotrichum tropicale]|nr:hypothetical protein CGCTS75_v008408 [Colletotrichum tropicale]